MATAFQLTPQTPSAAPRWNSPLAAKLGAAIEREMHHVACRDRQSEQDRYSELSRAFDAICEADNALGEAGWSE